MLLATFEEVNHGDNKYNEVNGFKKAQKELSKFYEKNLRLPVAREFPEIVNAIYRNYWVEIEIRNWNDLLKKVFSDVNKHDRLYIGYFEENLGTSLELNIGLN